MRRKLEFSSIILYNNFTVGLCATKAAVWVYFHAVFFDFLNRMETMLCLLTVSFMYISFSAFKTKEEAEQEGDNILQHDEVYINALTSNAYINQFYSERK